MKRTFSLIAALMLILCFSFPHSSHAIYQWVDEKGQVHITDYPKPSKEVEKEEKAPSGGETHASEPVRDEQAAQQPAALPEKKQPVQSQPSPAAVQHLTDTQVKKPAEPALQIPAQQTDKKVIPPAGKTVQPVPITPVPPVQAVPQPGMPAFPGFQNGPPPKMLAAMLAGFMTVILIVSTFYLYSSLCLFLIAKKLDVPAAWLAWIPFIQVYAFLRSAGKSLWWIFLFIIVNFMTIVNFILIVNGMPPVNFIPIVNFIPFVNLIVIVYLWMCIAENLGKNKWLGLLTLVPIANLILPAILAFSKKEGTGTSRPVATF